MIDCPVICRPGPEGRVLALAGNPNVGKSTLFNALTGLHQHTGNWPGKTVAVASGTVVHRQRTFVLVDLPGIYSLSESSAEEEIAGEFLDSGQADAVVAVCDGTCLERSLMLAIQVMERAERVVICVNLLDEAKRRGMEVDTAALSRRAGVPVVGISAGTGEGLEQLMDTVELCCHPSGAIRQRLPESTPEERAERAERWAAECVRRTKREGDGQRRLDRLLTGRITGLPVMAALLGLVLWLSVSGANVPSQFLWKCFNTAGAWLRTGLESLGASDTLIRALVDGVYRVLAWVVSVMLPPMAIFFPLFTLLEDLGYLPRVAFVLDRAFGRAGACGKQALTMCMGLGCNACGVTGCRIIRSPRERLIAILTNSFVPCNGRFPTLIALIWVFTSGRGFLTGAALFALLGAGVGMTLLMSRLLSATVLRGENSSYVLELPPYRKPRIGQILVRSVLDRTLFVLGRAVAVAAPAGLLIWLCANVYVGGTSLLGYMTGFFDPLGRLMGLDGVILTAFVLGWPANEIVVPIMLMCYLTRGALVEAGDPAQLAGMLTSLGWTPMTAVCAGIFTLFHWPCSTTCLTIAKETGSVKWTLTAIVLPTVTGMLLCMTVAAVWRLLG